MKKLLIKSAAIFLSLFLCIPTAAFAAGLGCGCPEGTGGAFTKGSGSEANPFRVTDEAQLRHISAHPEAHFRLDKDIRVSEDWEPLCAEVPFTGSLDGKKKTLILTAPLFALVGEDAHIFRLELDGEITVDADDPCIGFAAIENHGWLYQLKVTGSITVTPEADSQAAVGGIVGKNTGLLDGCSFDGSIADRRTGGALAGAMAGWNEPALTVGLPVMITAHSGFAAKGGAPDKREDNTLDNIIKSINLSPDAVEVDVRLYTDPEGNEIPVLAHDKDMVGPDCVTAEEVLKLLMGEHPRSGELAENGMTIPIQLDYKETAVRIPLFELIDRLGFPLSRVIFPVGTPASVAEDLDFWQEKAFGGLQIWVTPNPIFYDDPERYVASLDELQIPGLVVNMSFKDAKPEMIQFLADHGYGVSLWTLNSHEDIVEHMNLGLYNMTSRLEEVLSVREGFRTGILDCRWDQDLPAIGTGIPAPQAADSLPQPQESEPVWLVPAGLGLIALISIIVTIIKKRKNK